MKIKESEKIDKYLDLARGLKKLWNMEMAVISIVVSTLGMVPKSLGKLEIRERIETIQTTALLSSATILERVPRRLETTYCHFDFSKQKKKKKKKKITNRSHKVLNTL